MERLAERSEKRRLEMWKKRKKIMIRFTVISALVGTIGFVLFYIFFQLNRTYNGFHVIKEIEKTDASGVKYYAHAGRIIKYSKDGATMLKANGEILWDGSYEYKNPVITANGDYVVVADVGNKAFTVFDKEGIGKEIKTDAAIEQITVAEQGVVAAVLQDDDEAKINVYDPSDVTNTLKVAISTSTDSDGYPVAIALSDDGKKLVSSYVNISGGVVNSSLNFYNFSETGKNKVNRIIGSRQTGKNIAADVQFMDNHTIGAFGENEIAIYRMGDEVEDGETIKCDKAIRSVCYNRKNIAIVTANEGNIEKPNRLQVYKIGGNKILDKEIDYKYDTMVMGQEEVIFYNQIQGHIVRFRGSEKLDATFDDAVSYFFPSLGDAYIIINNSSIKQVRLSGRKAK